MATSQSGRLRPILMIFSLDFRKNEPMKIISNRAAIIVRAKAPFVEWVQSADADSSHITTEEVNEDPNVYLIYDPKKEGEIDID